MILAAVWLVGALAVGYAAAQRGRGGVGWFLFSALLSPLIGILVLLACPVRQRVFAGVPLCCAGCEAPMGTGDRFCGQCGCSATAPVAQTAGRRQRATWATLMGGVLLVLTVPTAIAGAAAGDYRFAAAECLIGFLLLMAGRAAARKLETQQAFHRVIFRG